MHLDLFVAVTLALFFAWKVVAIVRESVAEPAASPSLAQSLVQASLQASARILVLFGTAFALSCAIAMIRAAS